MSEFDKKAWNWDNEPIHIERSEAIAKCLLEMVPVNQNMKALEYGAGTGLLSFLLSDKFSEITLMDNSEEMVKVMQEKIAASMLKNLKPLLFDLEHTNYNNSKFDCIFSQMVLHHLPNTESFFRRCNQMLNKDGYFIIADLFTEDGSFHGPNANVHFGFNPDDIANTLKSIGFKDIKHKTCFVIKRQNGREYPVFLLVAEV